MTLHDHRTPKERADDETNNIHVIAGDIVYKNPWKKLAALMQQIKHTQFDLIVL